jgi:hypothetical protein
MTERWVECGNRSEPCGLNCSASISKDGRISLFDAADDFIASFVDNRWYPDQLFRWTDLEENFFQIDDRDEMMRIFAESRSALALPFRVP